MLISVTIPTYNRAHLVGKTVESILNQTYKNLEIIVVDDGSTDHTREIISSYAKNATIPVRYYKKVNGGCASACNTGVNYSQGDCVAFIGDDDQFTPTAMESLHSALNNSQADFAFSPAIEVYPNGREKINYPVAAHHPERLAVEHFKDTNVRACSVLFKKKIFQDIGGLDETLKFNEDSDFLQKVALRYKAAYSNVPTAKVFHHATNKSDNFVEIYKAMLKSAENILREFPDFKQTLGDTAEKRLNELKNYVVVALILADRFDEARTFVRDNAFPLNILLQILLRAQLSFPLKILLNFKRWLTRNL